MIKLYRGTNKPNETPALRNNINGVGFYMTRDIELARKYGKYIQVFESPVEVDVIRKVSEFGDAVEYVITKNTTLTNFFRQLEDEDVLSSHNLQSTFI